MATEPGKVGLRGQIRSFVDQPTGLDELVVDDLAVSTKLQSWEAVQIPDRLRFSSRLAVKLLLAFLIIIAFVPWTQTITVTGQLSAYSPYERPQWIESQITGRIKKWHIYEGVRVKQGDLIVELDDWDPNFMAPDLLVATLMAGLDYTLRITGRTNGRLGGNYKVDLAVTPVPGALLLLGPALAGLGYVGIRRRQTGAA